MHFNIVNITEINSLVQYNQLQTASNEKSKTSRTEEKETEITNC